MSTELTEDNLSPFPVLISWFLMKKNQQLLNMIDKKALMIL